MDKDDYEHVGMVQLGIEVRREGDYFVASVPLGKEMVECRAATETEAALAAGEVVRARIEALFRDRGFKGIVATMEAVDRIPIRKLDG